MKHHKSVRSQLLLQYTVTFLATDIAFDKRSRSQAQKSVNTACKAEAGIINTIAANGSLAEKIALECQLQQRDLQKYAKSPEDEKKIRQGLKDMEAGLASYSTLTERPKEYKRQAAQYTDRNRDATRDVPKDGMRYAIASQLTRLQNRQSLQLSGEEDTLLAARRTLVRSIQEDYSQLQQKVVHE